MALTQHGRVCKPYNSTLGEHFRCRWDVEPVAMNAQGEHVPTAALKSDTPSVLRLPGSTEAIGTGPRRVVYLTEQVSHHPPISAFYYVSAENNLLIYGDLRPRSKFLGNSAATLMGGETNVALLQRPEDGTYRISMPNMYARGIMFGRMVLELGDTSEVENKNNDLSSEVEFKVKGYFTGTYNAVAAKVQRGSKTIGELSGK